MAAISRLSRIIIDKIDLSGDAHMVNMCCNDKVKGIAVLCTRCTATRVPHGYGNTHSVSKTGNTGSGTVSDFGTPHTPHTRTAVLR